MSDPVILRRDQLVELHAENARLRERVALLERRLVSEEAAVDVLSESLQREARYKAIAERDAEAAEARAERAEAALQPFAAVQFIVGGDTERVARAICYAKWPPRSCDCVGECQARKIADDDVRMDMARAAIAVMENATVPVPRCTVIVVDSGEKK